MNTLKEYETVCVFAPDLAGDALKQVEDKIKKIFSNHKVEEVTRKDWGSRKLAYPINKYKTAHYVQFIYKAPAQLVNELEKNLGYEESVLRYLTVKLDKKTPRNVAVEPAGFELTDMY